ncbi:FAD dependent oxidoreductase domain-containing protein [Cadophora sp. MPI-SDFR-AT-0126]|nr:FAD dependent oxidoreductase domain-containing protein [Leotiomycetes sp. MPI-SDFR-AT-0126]
MPPSFNVLIVGGGLGGLAASVALGQKGHKVTVLESTAKLQTIGGGIGIPPNSMRVWDYLGLIDRLKAAAETQGRRTLYFRRYTGDLICESGLQEQAWNYDTVAIHRGQLQQLLVEAAHEAGVTILVNTRIIEIDDGGPSPVAVTKGGQRIEADLIIGADGAKSTIRNMMYPDIQLSSSINCYRAVVPGNLIKSDPDLAPLLECSTIWWGPERSVVCMAIQDKTMLSVECPHPGNTATAGEWNKPGDVDALKETYSDFDPVVKKLLAKIEPKNLLVWKLNQLPELKTWVSGSGKVVLLGDAAHAIMPYSGQGHAMAIEDSACLAECISRANSASSIPDALRAFETIRKPRNKHMADYALFNAHTWQLPDGEEQRRRDERLAKAPLFSARNWDGKHVDEFPGMPPSPSYYPWMLGHDVVDFTRRKLDEIWPSNNVNGCS